MQITRDIGNVLTFDTCMPWVLGPEEMFTEKMIWRGEGRGCFFVCLFVCSVVCLLVIILLSTYESNCFPESKAR